MKKENYTDLSTEELLKRKNTLKTLTLLLAAVLTVLLVFTVVTSLQKGFTALVAVPLALMPIVFTNWSQVKAIGEELQKRGQQGH